MQGVGTREARKEGAQRVSARARGSRGARKRASQGWAQGRARVANGIFREHPAQASALVVFDIHESYYKFGPPVPFHIYWARGRGRVARLELARAPPPGIIIC